MISMQGKGTHLLSKTEIIDKKFDYADLELHMSISAENVDLIDKLKSMKNMNLFPKSVTYRPLVCI